MTKIISDFHSDINRNQLLIISIGSKYMVERDMLTRIANPFSPHILKKPEEPKYLDIATLDNMTIVEVNAYEDALRQLAQDTFFFSHFDGRRKEAQGLF